MASAPIARNHFGIILSVGSLKTDIKGGFQVSGVSTNFQSFSSLSLKATRIKVRAEQTSPVATIIVASERVVRFHASMYIDVSFEDVHISRAHRSVVFSRSGWYA